MNMRSFDPSFFLMNEVKDMESQVLWALGKIPNKINLKFHLELNFYNFQERKNGNVLD